jgi:hypothetical protein
MNEKEIYSFLYMLYELKQGVVLYDLKYDFTDDLNGKTVGYIKDVGTDNEGTLYHVYNYDNDSIDVHIKGVKDFDYRHSNVPKIELCEIFDIHTISSMHSSTKDLVSRIHQLKAMVAYFDNHADDVKMLKMFEDNDVIVTNIASKPNFKLSDIQPIFDIIAT